MYIDPAWGRIQGIDELRVFFDESMRGLEDWRFPVTSAAVDGDHLLVRWTQILPSGHQQTGYSTLRYAGGGRFDYEEDVLNMVHVLEDLKASKWRPGPGFISPPPNPCGTPPNPDRQEAVLRSPSWLRHWARSSAVSWSSGWKSARS